MNRDDFVPLVPSEKLAEYYDQVKTFQAERSRSVVKINKFLFAGLGVSLIVNVALSWTIVGLLPLEKLVPLPLWVRADGSVDSESDMSRLPESMNEAVIEASIWQYVRLREGYVAATAQYNYDTVSLMSSDAVRSKYQAWFNYPNPASPQVTVGEKGQIDVEKISISPLPDDSMQLRFKRTVTLSGQRPAVTTWTVMLQYRKQTSVSTKSRLINPAAILITSYQSSEDGA